MQQHAPVSGGFPPLTTFQPLVISIAAQYRGVIPRGFEFEDLIGVGLGALAEAAQTYDAQHASRAKFSTFASWRIRSAILEFLRVNHTRKRAGYHWCQKVVRTREKLAQVLGREPRESEMARALGLSLEAYQARWLRSASPIVASLDDYVSGAEGEPLRLADVLPDPVAWSPKRSWDVLEVQRAMGHLTDRERRVVLALLEGVGQEELGRQFHVTGSRISQIYRGALRKLRLLLQDPESLRGEGE